MKIIKKIRDYCRVLLGCAYCAVIFQLHAAPINTEELSAREIIRQQQQEHAIREQAEQRPDVHLELELASEHASIPNDESPCFVIDRIQLQGSGADFFQKTLQKTLKASDSPLHRCLGVNGRHPTIQTLTAHRPSR